MSEVSGPSNRRRVSDAGSEASGSLNIADTDRFIDHNLASSFKFDEIKGLYYPGALKKRAFFGNFFLGPLLNVSKICFLRFDLYKNCFHLHIRYKIASQR